MISRRSMASFMMIAALLIPFSHGAFFAPFRKVSLYGVNAGLAENSPIPTLLVVNGRPAFIYSSPNGLAFYRSQDSLGSYWVTSRGLVWVDDNPIQSTTISAAIINARPAIVYYQEDTVPSKIKYIRATNIDGTAWGCPQTLIRIPTDMPSNLISAAGSPAMAFSGYTLWYLRASGINHDQWPVPVYEIPGPHPMPWHAIYEGLHHTSMPGWIPSLCLINGFPAVAMAASRDGNDGVRFIRARDSSRDVLVNGLRYDWGPLVTVTTTGHPTQIILKEVDGRPAIVYTTFTNNELRVYYVRATDPYGAVWPTPKLALWSTLYIPGVSFAVIRYKPVILYAEKLLWSIRSAVGRDVDGTAFDYYVLLESAQPPTTASFHSSLIDMNGRAAFLYMKHSGDLYYAYEPGCVPCGTRVCALMITVAWCQANCPNGRNGGACTPTFCNCPSSVAQPAPAPPISEEKIICTACNTSIDVECLGVADDRWCQLNCDNDGKEHNDICTKSVCLCPDAMNDDSDSANSQSSSSIGEYSNDNNGDGSSGEISESSSESLPDDLPCIPCTKESDANCYGVADAFWCSANCIDGIYGGSCQSYICFCPSAEPDKFMELLKLQ